MKSRTSIVLVCGEIQQLGQSNDRVFHFFEIYWTMATFSHTISCSEVQLRSKVKCYSHSVIWVSVIYVIQPNVIAVSKRVNVIICWAILVGIQQGNCLWKPS